MSKNIEIKGYRREDAKKKFEEFKNRYLNESILVLQQKELKEENILI